MPYMQCNGRTVSRYSSTPEVEQCKKAEKKAYAEQYAACTASIECKADRDHTNEVAGYIIGFGFICFILMCIFMVKMMNGLIDE